MRSTVRPDGPLRPAAARPEGCASDLTESPALAFADAMAGLGPFGPAPRMVAGVSGGPHSLALALLARDWLAARSGRLLAVVCDHRLRPESATEAAAVAASLARQGIESRIVALDIPPGSGLQERARAARLAALLGICAGGGAPWLLLGHHRADQAETFLLRAMARSGPAGLAAMRPARAAAEALVLRPLLGMTPAALESVCTAAGLVPVRDASNADRRFTRAQLRAALADPDGTGPAIARLANAAEGFAARRDAAEAELARRLAGAALLHEEGFARLDMPALGRDEVALIALGRLARVIGGGAFTPATAAIARLLEAGQGTLGGAVLRRDGLLLREAGAMAPPVAASAGAAWDHRFRLHNAVPGAMLGPAGEAARRLARPPWLPAAVAPTLPALYIKGTLAAVPALAYPSSEVAARHRIAFAPAAGPVA
jgi:tRNA(Ile)-lysidine synthase